MYRKILLLVILLLILTVGISFARQSKNKGSYILPSNNLNVELITAKPFWNGTAQKGKVIIEVMSGRPTDIQINLTCSHNLEIEKQKFTLDALEAGGKKEITFDILPNAGGKTDEGESWVRVLVSYLPDYQAMETLVNDKKLYPNEDKRKNLIKIFEANKEAQKRGTGADVVEFKKASQKPGTRQQP